MKRDLDLVRCILVTSEDAPCPVDGAVLSRCCGDLQKVAFHVELMRSHGLIEAEVSYDGFNRVPLGWQAKAYLTRFCGYSPDGSCAEYVNNLISAYGSAA